MTDGLNAVWSNDRAAPTDTNPKNLELAPPQSLQDIKFTHTSSSATNKYIQPYQHKVFAWTWHGVLMYVCVTDVMDVQVHQDYSTYCRTYHHPEHRFRSWPTQMTSNSHTQARVQPTNTYNHTNIECLPGQNKTISH